MSSFLLVNEVNIVYFLILSVIFALGYIIKSVHIKRRLTYFLIPLVVVFIYKFEGQILGYIPATTFLMMISNLKAFETQNLRDQKATLLFALLFTLSESLFLQGIISTFILIGLIAFYMTYMYELSKNNLHLFSFLLSFKRLMKLFLYSVPCVAILFFVFPRVGQEIFALPNQKQITAQIGLSDELKPGTIQNLVNDESIVFSASINQKISDYYWRVHVLGFTNDGWIWKKYIKEASFNRDNIKFNIENDTKISQVIYQNLDLQKSVVSLDYPQIIIDTKYSFNKWANLTFSLESKRDKNLSYTVVSQKLEEVILTSQERRRYLRTPDISDRLTELVEDFKKSNNPVRALNEYFKDQFTYTMVNAQSQSLDDFLFNTKKGYCEHFAASYALILRLLGYPSRVVTGFLGAEYNEIGNFYLIRQKQAHAWVEYYKDQMWHRVDPTSFVDKAFFGRLVLQTNEVRSEGRFILSTYYRLKSYYDYAENTYNLFMNEYDFSSQFYIVKQLLGVSVKPHQLFRLSIFLIFLFVIITFIFTKYSFNSKNKAYTTYHKLIHILKSNGFKIDGQITIKEMELKIISLENKKYSKLFYDYVQFAFKS